MPEFNLDDLKKTWQEHEVKPKYGNSDILEMLNKKSRNYVKYIFWISIAEFVFFLGVTIFYVFRSEDTNSFLSIIERLGIEKTEELEKDFEHLYFGLKIVSLLITAFFVLVFYLNYRKIKIESNLKKFILQIIRFRKTVNLFIFTNIFLLVFFTLALTVFIFAILSQQHIKLDSPTFTGFIIGLVGTTVLSIVLIWVYYRIVYGIIIRRLGKKLKELQEIEASE